MADKTILIVEDMEANIKLYSIILEPLDVNILSTDDGQEAFELIKNQTIDLVILDIQIPGKSGMEIIKDIREIKGPDEVNFLAVTGYSMPKDRDKILKAGCNYYMSKPIDTDKFLTQVKEILGI